MYTQIWYIILERGEEDEDERGNGQGGQRVQCA